MYIYQNLIENTQIFVSGFFPEFPDPVFSGKKKLRGLAGGQTHRHSGHFDSNYYYISPSVTWRELEYTKFTSEDEKIWI